MISEYLRTLSHVFKMRGIVGYNGLVYALKRLPLIGKIIPDRLYATKELKAVYLVYRILKESFLMFIGKILGLGIIYAAAMVLKSVYRNYEYAQGMSDSILYSNIALFLFLAYSLAGTLLNTNMFRCTTEKEYMVFMLRMDAKKLNDALFVYDLAKLVIGYLLAGIVAIICGAPVFVWLGFPLLAVFIKLFAAGALAFFYEIKHKHNRSMKRNIGFYTVKLSIAMISAPLLFIVLMNGGLISFNILIMISALLVIFGIWGYFKLKMLDPFLHRKALQDNIVRIEAAEYKRRSKDNTRSFKKIKAVGNVSSSKKGFEYLNALFVRRHRGMLYVKPLIFTLTVAAITGLYIYSNIREYYVRFGSDNCLNMVLNNLKNLLMMKRYDDNLLPFDKEDTFMLFLRWLSERHLLALLIPISLSDNTFKSTQAMYINCDNSLMTLSFFKQPKKILELFDIRLRQMFKINMIPAIAYGVVADLILFYSGGADHPLYFTATIFVSLLLCLLYSMTDLLLYYLFQPFTTTVNVKSGAYMIFSVVKWIFYSMVFWIPCRSDILALILIVIDYLYIIAARKLVYRYAPRTWRIKS